ncbi:hypothetical protein LXL04_039437 [Taraxacum kok-saghyz]
MKDHMPDKRYKAPSNKQTHERPHARQTIQGTLQQTDGKGHMPDKRYKSPSNKQTHERTHARQTIQGTVEYLLPRRTPDGSLYSQIFCAPANRNTCSQRYRLEAGLEDGDTSAVGWAVSADGVEQVMLANAQEEVEHGRRKGRPYDLKTPPIPCHFLKSRPRFSPMPHTDSISPTRCLISSHSGLVFSHTDSISPTQCLVS